MSTVLAELLLSNIAGGMPACSGFPEDGRRMAYMRARLALRLAGLVDGQFALTAAGRDRVAARRPLLEKLP